MSAHPLRIPELDEVVERGSPERRTKTLERITALFLDGADRFNDDHVQLFDLVFSRLIAEIEARARTELSQRLAPLANAPFEVVRRLARDDDIAVAGPLIGQSCRLADNDLMRTRLPTCLSMGFGAFLAAAITISYAAVALRNVPAAGPEGNRIPRRNRSTVKNC